MWKIWHNLLIRFDRDKTVNFMNYGYAPLNGDEPLKLKKEDEVNRYCIQLYDHIINRVDVKAKKILEVGSGRGGGANYISRYYQPDSYTGVDISPGVINFCNQYYKSEGLKFLEGRAEKLPVKSNYYDALVNVESARCYSDLDLFFNEVFRVLKKDGYFLFADMIEKDQVDTIMQKIVKNGFKIIEHKDITRNVAKGLEMDTERRQELIKKRIPGFLQKSFESFAGTKGTRRFNSFSNGKFTYMSFVLRKTPAEEIQMKSEMALSEINKAS
jgi:ubiquinone/menaquinone biosynthesis C-methylase UbiE